MQSKTVGNEIAAALSRSVLYDALALGLQTPSREGVEQLAARRMRQACVEAARCLEREMEVESAGKADAVAPITASAGIWARELARLDTQQLLLEHARLFGHTVRGRVCPYESEYGQNALFQQSHQLADLTGFYAAFGLELDEAVHERADHIACELEFMHFLARKEAYALETRDDAMLEGTRRGARLFLQEHLGKFGRAVALSLQETGEKGFYAGLGRVLHECLLLDSRRQGIETGPPGLQLRPESESDVPMQCGGACDPAACASGPPLPRDA